MSRLRRPQRKSRRAATTHCLNCGHDFEGRFCPNCGQNANTRRLTWIGWWRTFLDVWGLGDTPFVRTLWSLVSRPGHMIGDYLDGKRAGYFSPAKSLAIVAATTALVRWVFPGTENSSVTPTNKQDEMSQWIDNVYNAFETWSGDHILFSLLLAHATLILPIKLMYRNAPLHPSTTIPEGIFIQVFIIIQMLMLAIAWTLVKWGHVSANDIYVFPGWIALIIIAVDLKQLFGFSWWDTIWRLLTSLTLALIILFTVVLAVIIALVIAHHLRYI